MGIFDWIKFNLYLRKLKRNKLPNDIKNPNGENVTYYPNGKLKEKFNKKNGKIHGIFKTYNGDGQLISQSEYKNGCQIFRTEDGYIQNGVLYRDDGSNVSIKKLRGLKTLTEKRILNTKTPTFFKINKLSYLDVIYLENSTEKDFENPSSSSSNRTLIFPTKVEVYNYTTPKSKGELQQQLKVRVLQKNKGLFLQNKGFRINREFDVNQSTDLKLEIHNGYCFFIKVIPYKNSLDNILDEKSEPEVDVVTFTGSLNNILYNNEEFLSKPTTKL